MDESRRVKLLEEALLVATETMCSEGQGFGDRDDLWEVAADAVARRDPEAWQLDMLRAKTGSEVDATYWAEHGTLPPWQPPMMDVQLRAWEMAQAAGHATIPAEFLEKAAEALRGEREARR